MKPESESWWPEWNRRTTVRAVLVLLSLLLLGGVVWSDRHRLAPLSDVSVGQLLVVLALTACAHWLNALEFWVLYRRLGVAIGVLENWLLFTAGQLLNHLPAQVGTIYRFRYLKVVRQTGLATATSGYASNLVITLASTGALGLVATIWAGANGADASSLTVAFALMLVFALGLLVVPLPRRVAPGASRIRRFIGTVIEGWADVRADPRTAGAVAAIELVKYFIAAWRMQLAFGWLGFEEGYAYFLVLAPVAGITSFIGLTPAALGFRELGISGAALALGRPLQEGILGATVDRAALFAVSVVLGGVGLVYTSRRINRAESTSESEPGSGPLLDLAAEEREVLRPPSA